MCYARGGWGWGKGVGVQNKTRGLHSSGGPRQMECYVTVGPWSGSGLQPYSWSQRPQAWASEMDWSSAGR